MRRLASSRQSDLGARQALLPWLSRSYAGLAAERLLHPAVMAEGGAGLAYERAGGLIAAWRLDGPALEIEAAMLVHKHRGAIEALVEALLREDRLSAEEVTLVLDCMACGYDWDEALGHYRRTAGAT